MKSAFFSATCCLSLLSFVLCADPLGTHISYQCSLSEHGQPAEGTYDMRLALYHAQEGGVPVGSALTNARVAINNGVFSTSMDFGQAALEGNAVWQELGVRPADSESSWSILAPRLWMYVTPYSIFSQSAATVADGSVKGSKIPVGTLESQHLKRGFVGQEQWADGVAVRSLTILTGHAAIVGEGDIGVSTVGNTVIVDKNEPVVADQARRILSSTMGSELYY